MPTAKRERQRAGRATRVAAAHAVSRRRKRTRQGIIAAVVVLAAVGIVYAISRPPKNGCPASDGSSPRRTTFTKAPATCISKAKTYTAAITTDVGSFTISLDSKAAPKTVNDFVYLALYHFYKGLSFHRVIPGFVVQGGDPNPATKAHPNPSGPQGPGYTVSGEVPKAGAYEVGSVVMAKTSSEHAGAAGSQFFIVVGKSGAQLPPQYSLFGKVTAGMSVVNRIAADGGPAPTGYPKVVHKIESISVSS
ncbi:MAG: peptidylprolyl isomerase [Acidimicrobiales bacterium]